MRYPRGMPLAIFVLVAAITLLSVFAIEQQEDERLAAQLRGRATAIASALERRANASSSYLRAGAALLATADDLPASRFRRFVGELRLDADYRGADGIGWAPVVRQGEVAEWEEMVREQVPGAVRLHPPLDPAQQYAAPVTFLQPDTERNRRAIGFDMFSDPVRRQAMLEAERTARPTASGKVVLRQEGDAGEPGFLIYMPVFQSSTDGRQLNGFIYSPFNAQDFLSSALELEDAGEVRVRLYDRDVEDDRLLAEIGASEGEGKVLVETISIANNPWVLEIAAGSGAALSGLALVTLILGLLVASLLMLVIRMLTQQAIEDEAALRYFQEQASIRNSLTRELNHRVKNTLANVLSIIALTRRRAESLDDFAEGLDGRIRALSATHDLLTQSDWGTTPIRAVVETELAPYARGGENRLELLGPEVELAPNDALSLGLAMHELATNAAKYGALSQPGGHVRVSWRAISDKLVRLEWVERGGPPVSVTSERSRGFGTDLIEKIVAHELDNPVELIFEEEGVRCTLTIPVRQPTPFAIRAKRKPQAA